MRVVPEDGVLRRRRALKPKGSEGLVTILKLSFSSLSKYYRHLAAGRAPRKGGGGAFVDENYN